MVIHFDSTELFRKVSVEIKCYNFTVECWEVRRVFIEVVFLFCFLLDYEQGFIPVLYQDNFLFCYFVTSKQIKIF